ncbi:MAG: DUF4401 domain-containing protein [Burkholderiales bacterium]
MSALATAWGRLAGAGFVQGERPPENEDAAPWYVTAMIGTAAWIAALFMLGFVGAALSALLRDGGSLRVVGLVLCVAAIGVLRLRAIGLFLRQVAVAFSLAGQALVVFGFLDHHLSEPFAWAGIALFEALLVAAAADTVHHTLAALAGLVALRLALVTGGVPWLVAPLLIGGVLALQLADARLPAQEALWAPLWAALALVVVALPPLAFLDAFFWDYARAARPVALARVGGVLAGIGWLAVVAALVRTSGVALHARATALVAAGALVVAVCAWRIPEVVLALALLLAAFAGGRRVLAGVAVVAVLASLAYAYYTLQGSLLAKSGALAVAGAVMLAASAGARLAGDRGDGDA